MLPLPGSDIALSADVSVRALSSVEQETKVVPSVATRAIVRINFFMVVKCFFIDVLIMKFLFSEQRSRLILKQKYYEKNVNDYDLQAL